MNDELYLLYLHDFAQRKSVKAHIYYTFMLYNSTTIKLILPYVINIYSEYKDI